MLSLSTTQLAIVSSAYKKVSWLFEVIPADKSTTHFWATVTRSYGGFDYTFKIPPSSFRGITLNRAKSETGIQAPNDLSFTVLNSDSALSASDFVGGSVILRLVVSDGTNEDQIRIWKFDVSQCESQYRKLFFVCQDFVQKYLDGDYPNTKLIKDISRSTDTDLNDNICVVVPFGECYPPLRSLYITDSRYYLLGGGSGGETYAIQRVRSPRGQGAKSEWNSEEYTFSQSEKIIGLETWDVFQPIIADSDADGVADACGLWKDGDHFADMPTQFLRSDTASLTNPADVIEFVLEDIGVQEMEFDNGFFLTEDWEGTVGDTDLGISSDDLGITETLDLGIVHSFDTSFDTYASWGLTFNGAYFYKQPREKVLAQLVNMCHSTLIVTDRVELRVLSKVSQKTITKADVIRTQAIGEGTFRRTAVTQDQSDSGHIAFQEADEAQDEFLKALVPAKSSMDNISSEILEIPFVQDSQDAQRIGILYYQRKLLREADIGFTSKGTLLALQPDDVITINHADYGGTYDVLIDSMTINRDISIDFQCTKFSEDLDDWEDLSPDAITFVTDDTGTYWAPIICGPDGNPTVGDAPSILTGFLIVGNTTNRVIIDPTGPTIKVDEGGVDRVIVGELAANEYGIRGNDVAGNLVFKIDTSGALIGGWTFNETTLSSANITLDQANDKITVNTITIDGANDRIRSANYVSGYAGAGFTLEPDLLEVGNIACRGIFRTAVFQKDVLSVVSGGVVVTKGGDVLAADMTALDASPLTIEGNETFSVGDILRIKDESDDEWLEVTNIASAPIYTVTRDKGSDYGADSNIAWTKGASVTNYGQSGDGGILLTASETNAPYMNIFTHAGAPWTTLTTRVRIGNLNGFLDYASDLYGIAIGETNKYLKYDPTNGLRLKSSEIELTDGNIKVLAGGDIIIEAGGDLHFVGSQNSPKIEVDATGNYFKFTSINYWQVDSIIGQECAVHFLRVDASPSDDDWVTIIECQGPNSAQAPTIYAGILARSTTVLDGSEEGRLYLYGMHAGSYIAGFYFDFDGNAYADLAWNVFSPKIEIENPRPHEYLEWALGDAKKPLKPYRGLASTQEEIIKYAKDPAKIAIGLAHWAEWANDEIKKLRGEIEALKSGG